LIFKRDIEVKETGHDRYLVSNPRATYLFTVQGDSMIGAGIVDGDKVVVDHSVEARHDDIVLAQVNNEFTLKRLYRRDGVTELRPENPAYPTITFKEGDELRVWGVVVGLVRRYTGRR
jgi:DNA polymerase V